jgi:hypothetical protein
MTDPWTDEGVGALLQATFASREGLLSPERLARASTVPPALDRRRAPLLAAAAVLLVAGLGTVAAVALRGDGPDGVGPEVTPTTGTTSPTTSSTIDPAADEDRVREADRASELAAGQEADRVLEAIPQQAGAQRVTAAEVPPLETSTAGMSGSEATVTRDGFWLVAGDAEGLADWYSTHPPDGMHADGGPHSVGGSSNSDGSWSFDTILDAEQGGPASHSSVFIQVTPVGSGSGVRITVYTSWSPARRLTSYTPDDVTSVRIVDTRNGNELLAVVTDPADIERLRTAYDTLPGTAGHQTLCPALLDFVGYRLTFVSPTRTVRVEHTGYCQPVWSVWVDGDPVEPAVLDTDGFQALVESVVGP